MSRLNLRKRKDISYYEAEEPAFDEYVYCAKCADFVIEYCSIHGPLLVVPDDMIPAKPNFPSLVPRAALTIPHVFLHLAPSIIPGAGIGVFSTLTLPRGVRFGPYRGQRTNDIHSMYCWQIYDRNNKPSHAVDAADCDKSNWMRYVNCARHWREQNLLAYQYHGQLYYSTVKTIPPFTELMVFYGRDFAIALRIDLGLYNSEQHYQGIIETSQKSYREIKLNTNIEQPTEIPRNDGEALNYFEITGHDAGCEIKVDSIEQAITDLNKTSDLDTAEHVTCMENIVEIYDYKHTNDTQMAGFNTSSPITGSRDDGNQCFKVELNNDNKKWKCELCQKILSEKRSLKKHYLTHELRFRCDRCDYKTNHRIHFNYHTMKHDEENVLFECQSCDYTSRVKKNMNSHLRNHKNANGMYVVKSEMSATDQQRANGKYQCGICDYVTNNKRKYFKHKSEHIKTYSFRCHLCSYTGYLEEYLQRHINKIHNVPPIGLH